MAPSTRRSAGPFARGYDRDFAQVRDDDKPVAPVGPAPGWRRLEWDAQQRRCVRRAGVWLDLGATARRWPPTASRRGGDVAGCGVLVSLGGDIAIAGEPPGQGWIGVSDDHEDPEPTRATLTAGGLATSGTFRRRAARRPTTSSTRARGDVAAPLAHGQRRGRHLCRREHRQHAAIVMGRAAPGWRPSAGCPPRGPRRRRDAASVEGWPA